MDPAESMGTLARLEAREGKRADGVALLCDCIARIRADAQCSPDEVETFSRPLLAALAELDVER